MEYESYFFLLENKLICKNMMKFIGKLQRKLHRNNSIIIIFSGKLFLIIIHVTYTLLSPGDLYWRQAFYMLLFLSYQIATISNKSVGLLWMSKTLEKRFSRSRLKPSFFQTGCKMLCVVCFHCYHTWLTVGLSCEHFKFH